MPIPGARPIRPGDLEELWAEQKHDEILERIKYLVNDDLEEPPHIQRAREILQTQGGDWLTATEMEILKIIDSLPRHLFNTTRTLYPRHPKPDPSCPSHGLLARIHKSQVDYYNLSSDSPSSAFLAMLQNAKHNPSPGSLPKHLQDAGITINKVVHFTHPPSRKGNIAAPQKVDRVGNLRKLFVVDLARFLGGAQGTRGTIPHATWVMPPGNDKEIEKGIMKLDGRSFVLDTTMNGSVVQAICEGGFRPGVIMTEFTFWRDGADQDGEALKRVAPADYGVTHWLTQYYDVYSRHPGSGFVTCNPTIYIRKGRSLMFALKSTASNLVRGSSSKTSSKPKTGS